MENGKENNVGHGLSMNTIYNMDCIEGMKLIPNGSIDAIITDPPYEIGFMGKGWDDTGIANNVDMWKECLRVLKPGGHLLSFAATRTYHRMASAIEDAGFEVRDMIEWVYGSGFPKSLNIGKMIDKRGGESVGWFGKWLREWREKENIHQKEISKLFPSKTGGLTGCVANWELGLNLPTTEQFNLICKTFNLPFNSLVEAERQIVGEGEAGFLEKNKVFELDNEGYGKFNITKGTSAWEGWGTALKPAHEPICMARKPLAEKTVAENVLKYGTGGINIDESRVETSDKLQVLHNETGEKDLMGNMKGKDAKGRSIEFVESGLGRFPANLIHDNSEEVRECFPETKSTPRTETIGGTGGIGVNTNFQRGSETSNFNDSGNASRFFKSIIYQAKASKSERNRGCEGLEEKNMDTDGEGRNQAGFNSADRKPMLPRANNHPTVKPIALMEYLIKMVTPKGGVVLDPFAGSGTTLVAAKKNGYNYIGFELDEGYYNIANKRIQDRLSEK